MKFAFAIAALTSMVTFVTAAPQASASPSAPVARPPHVYLSTDKCTITQAVDKPEGQGWGWKGGNAWIFEFKDTYIKEKFNVAYYPEKNGDCDFAATAQLKLQCTINVHAPLTKNYDVSVTNKAPYNTIVPYEANIFTMDCPTI